MGKLSRGKREDCKKSFTYLSKIANWLSDSYYCNPKVLEEKYGLKYIASEYNSFTGFSAIAVMEGRDVVLLFPGTKNLQDIASDICISVGQHTPQSAWNVDKFVEKVVTEVVSRYGGKIPGGCTSLGHSMGCLNSDMAVSYLVHKLLVDAKDIKSITIESPGTKKWVEGLLKDEMNQYLECFEIYNSKKPNGLNSNGKHVNTPHLVEMRHLEERFEEIEKSLSQTKQLLCKTLESHAVENFAHPDVEVIVPGDSKHSWFQSTNLGKLSGALVRDAVVLPWTYSKNAAKYAVALPWTCSKGVIQFVSDSIAGLASNLYSHQISDVESDTLGMGTNIDIFDL